MLIYPALSAIMKESLLEWGRTTLKVTLLAYTPEPEKTVAAAAKLCYSSAGIDEIEEGLTPERVGRFLGTLSDVGHESPVEHVSFTFGIEGVSRSLLAQITRHRIASFSVKSQRYVKEGGFSYVVPPEIDACPAARERFAAAMERDRRDYEELFTLLFERRKAEYLAEGKSEDEAAKAAEKSAAEDARFVLPNACETQLVLTMNARSLRNFFRLRCCNRAQWEIRALADEMFRLVYAVAPGLFEKAGPSCLYGKCSEGKMSCGKSDAVREHFAAMKAGR